MADAHIDRTVYVPAVDMHPTITAQYDIVVFADSDETQNVNPFAFDDSANF